MVFGLPGKVAVVDILGDLLRAERDQHADDDDAKLPGDGVPAVRRTKLEEPEHPLPLIGSGELRPNAPSGK